MKKERKKERKEEMITYGLITQADYASNNEKATKQNKNTYYNF
jgi:hypothetical protein